MSEVETPAPSRSRERLNARSGSTHSSEIVALGHAYPSEIVDNETFLARCRFPIRDDPAALAAETGMRSRYWCTEDENTWTLARSAVRTALASDPKLREQIDVVLVASGTTMPILYPARKDDPGQADLAPLVLHDIGRDDALGMDIKAIYCTGFLRGLQTMDALLANPNYRAGLVVATEQGSRFAVHEANRSTFCYIMSDAAGAAVLRRGPPKARTGLIDYIGYTDASKHDWIGLGADGASTIMRGSRAGVATHEMLVDCAHTLLERNGLTVKDLDWVLPIQTHARIIEGFRAAIDCPREKLLWFGGETGFSGSASIPACLAERVSMGTVRKGELLLSVAVGGGMNCAGALYYY